MGQILRNQVQLDDALLLETLRLGNQTVDPRDRTPRSPSGS
jgi:hypothetical protein